MKGKLANFLILMVCFLMAGSFLFSQIRESGTIHGNVYDEQGNPLPGVTITISGLKLIGGARTYLTDGKGYYRFSSLPVSSYSISAELMGFVKTVREIAQLSANTTLTADFTMKQMTVKEEVIVIARSPMVDISNSSSGNIVMSDKLILSLPAAKEFAGLMGMATGVERVNITGTNYIAAYGMGTGESNGYLFDGIDVSSSLYGTMYFSPDFNTIQEASVSGLGLPAEFGGFTGAVLSAISKSGSNKFSGLFETWYNSRDWNSQNLGKYSADRFTDPADKNKKYEAGSYFNTGLQVGGRIIRDKLWFFVSGQYDRTKNYPLGYAEDQTGTNTKGLMKLSYQLNSRMKMNFSASYDNEKRTNAYASPSFSPEADVNFTTPGLFLDLNMTSILSQNTLLEIKLGYNRKKQYVEPKNGIDLAGHYDFATGIYTINSSSYNKNLDRTNHVSAHLSHYIPELLIGSHDMKIGAEIIYSKPIWSTGYPGGANYYDWDGEPYFLMVSTPANYESKHSFSQSTAFAQDSWRVNQRLTLNLGLRFDSYWYKIPSPDRGVTYKNQNFAPRLGLSYDLLGDRKNVIKFHYGHYYDKLYRNLFDRAETNGPNYDYYLWNGTEYSYLYSSKSDFSMYHIDPKTKQPYIREISCAFERELFRDASLSVTYYYRKAARFLGWVNTAGRWKEVAIVNPGFDGIAGTSDDLGTMTVYELLNPGENSYLLTNPTKGQYEAMIDNPKFSAQGLEVIFSKRYSNRWQMITSYHYTRVKGNTESLFTSLGSSPNSFVNTYGEIGQYFYGQPHQFKLQANVLLPWDIDMGVIAQYSSGADKGAYFYAPVGAQTLSINISSPGTYKYEPKKQVDLRMQKQFDLVSGKLSLMADVFNVFNSSRVLSVYNLVGSMYDKISYVQAPRTFRIGLRFAY